MILNGFQKIIFQNRYVALETPSRPPPFIANAILNFHFDFPHPSLTSFDCVLILHPHAAATTSESIATTIDGGRYLQKKKQRVDGPQGLSQKFADNPSILTQCHKLNTIRVDWVKIEEYLQSR